MPNVHYMYSCILCPFVFPECSEVLYCELHPTKYGIMLSTGTKISGPEISTGHQTMCDVKTTTSDVKSLSDSHARYVFVCFKKIILSFFLKIFCFLLFKI